MKGGHPNTSSPEVQGASLLFPTIARGCRGLFLAKGWIVWYSFGGTIEA